jgi:DNA helicase-2/ATP-dependent DNA helicase PcrA
MSARDTLGMILREHFNWVSKPPANPIERHSWNVLAAVQSLADEMPATATAADLLADLTHRAEVDVEPTVNAVTLSTIHAAKGLEWEIVHIAGVSDGLLPLSFATDDAAIAEERRLLYVAVTRAKKALSMSWSERGANQSSTRTRSRFIPAALAATDTRTPGE